mgnify:CR=1 FL=1
MNRIEIILSELSITVSVIVDCQLCRNRGCNNFTNYTNQNQIGTFVKVWLGCYSFTARYRWHGFLGISRVPTNSRFTGTFVSYNSNQALPKIRQDLGISYISLVATTEHFPWARLRRDVESCKLHIRNVDVFYYTVGALTDCYFDAK